mmetsp:Transcript_90054/g.150547  ORF Transcript_90054/g.150547 Transcript_90054/m.150547 type:complete len:211 (+) Transcript_90054:237-869(+)
MCTAPSGCSCAQPLTAVHVHNPLLHGQQQRVHAQNPHLRLMCAALRCCPAFCRRNWAQLQAAAHPHNSPLAPQIGNCKSGTGLPVPENVQEAPFLRTVRKDSFGQRPSAGSKWPKRCSVRGFFRLRHYVPQWVEPQPPDPAFFPERHPASCVQFACGARSHPPAVNALKSSANCTTKTCRFRSPWGPGCRWDGRSPFPLRHPSGYASGHR